MAGFQPQANLPFVAAYVADAKGFFAEEGLKVNIQHASGADEHLKLLLAGTVDFTTTTVSLAMCRPMTAATSSTCWRSAEPFSPGGVPTATMTISEAAIASGSSIVNESRPFF